MISVIVLGSGAGGGVPQWNSAARACVRARAHDPASPPRTQASIALSGDGVFWHVVNASPDLRAQFAATPELHPAPDGPIRATPLGSVLLTGAEIDTLAGLLTLRERQGFDLRATPGTLSRIAENPIFSALSEVRRLPLDPGTDVILDASGLSVRALAIPGKAPLYAEGPVPDALAEDEAIALRFTRAGRTLLYVPGCAVLTPALRDAMDDADLLFLDGTLWTDDEMIAAKASPKSGRRMGHLSLSGQDGTLAQLADCRARTRVLIHLNNTNPVTMADTPERAEAEALGWRVAEDGMRLTA